METMDNNLGTEESPTPSRSSMVFKISSKSEWESFSARMDQPDGKTHGCVSRQDIGRWTRCCSGFSRRIWRLKICRRTTRLKLRTLGAFQTQRSALAQHENSFHFYIVLLILYQTYWRLSCAMGQLLDQVISSIIFFFIVLCRISVGHTDKHCFSHKEYLHRCWWWTFLMAVEEEKKQISGFIWFSTKSIPF